MRRHRQRPVRSIPPRVCFLICLALLGALGASAPAAGASGTWLWPVSGPVIRGFEPPGSPYGPGHRGIDIAAPVGTQVKAADAGTVSFAGTVGSQVFLTISHSGGLSSTYSWLSQLLVHAGDLVVRGQPVALSGWGHPGGVTPCLHLGAKLGSSYVDPLNYLRSVDVASLIRLAPLLTPFVSSPSFIPLRAQRALRLAPPRMARPWRPSARPTPLTGARHTCACWPH